MDSWLAHNADVLEGSEPLDASFVELVIAVSECSEDESEIFDRIDRLLESGRVRLCRA